MNIGMIDQHVASPDLPEFTAARKRLLDETMARIAVSREKLLEAWIAETGILPSEAVLVVEHTGIVTRCYVERRDRQEEFDLAENQTGVAE